MDELNETYFYAGKSSANVYELLFMAYLFNTAEQSGSKDIAAIYALYAGKNDQKKRTKPGTAIPGTSRMAKWVRKTFSNIFPFGIKIQTWWLYTLDGEIQDGENYRNSVRWNYSLSWRDHSFD